MRDSPAKILAQFLRGCGIFTDNFPLYLSFQPELAGGPDNVGTIYDTEGVKDGRLMLGNVIEHHGIMVRVRAFPFDSGWAKLQQVRGAFEMLPSTTQIQVGTNAYILRNISQIGTANYIGLEEGAKRRPLFTCNWLATIEEIQTTRFNRITRILRSVLSLPSALLSKGKVRRRVGKA